jgi:sulfate permease, SulP family
MPEKAQEFMDAALRLLRPRLATQGTPYVQATFKKDAIAGITVAAIIIPNALGYAILAGLPPVMGLYAALPALLFAALWGSSSHTITAPVGVVSLLSGAALTQFATPLSSEFITFAIALALLTGLIQCLLGLMRMGVLARLIPHSALIGFTSAAACIITATQIPALVGITAIPGFGLTPFIATLINIPYAHGPTLTLGLITLFSIIVLRKYTPVIPASLLAVITGIVIGSTYDVTSLGIATIGYIPSGIPQFTLAAFSLPVFYLLLKQAALIALVGFVETYSISKSLSQKTKERISADKELFGQGAANIGAGLLGGFPVSGSFSGSALNLRTGAQTNIAAICASISIFLALLALSPLLSHMPRTMLAAILIAAVMQLVDIRSLKETWRVSKSDGIIATITALTAIIIKPDDALFVGICIGIALFIIRSMRLRIHEVGYHNEHGSLWSRSSGGDAITRYPSVLILRVDTSLIFANADALHDTVSEYMQAHTSEFNTKLKAVVLNGAGLNYIDITGVENLRELRDELLSQNIELRFMLIKDTVIDILTKADLFDSAMYINGPRELSEWAQTI